MLKNAIMAASAAAVLATVPELNAALVGEPTTPSEAANAIRARGFPEHLSVDPGSPYYKPEVARLLGVNFEGAKRPGDVREYCIEDLATGRGWVRIEVRLPNGKPRIERGKYITIRKEGIIKPYWR